MVIKQPTDLPLPPLLTELLRSGRWRQPSDDATRRAFPMIACELEFLLNERSMIGEQVEGFVEVPERYWVYRGLGERDLPWLDVNLVRPIAINKIDGYDSAVVLDYRTGADNPRVVASDWTGDHIVWVEAFRTFDDLAKALQLWP
jgi:hypothetical protein